MLSLTSHLVIPLGSTNIVTDPDWKFYISAVIYIWVKVSAIDEVRRMKLNK